MSMTIASAYIRPQSIHLAMSEYGSTASFVPQICHLCSSHLVGRESIIGWIKAPIDFHVNFAGQSINLCDYAVQVVTLTDTHFCFSFLVFSSQCTQSVEHPAAWPDRAIHRKSAPSWLHLLCGCRG